MKDEFIRLRNYKNRVALRFRVRCVSTFSREVGFFCPSFFTAAILAGSGIVKYKFYKFLADIGSMLILLDPSELSPALLYCVKNLVQHPKAESSLVDPTVSSMTTTLPFTLGVVYMIPDWVSFRNETEFNSCVHGKCVPGIETRAKLEMTMAINNILLILAALILSAISALCA